MSKKTICILFGFAFLFSFEIVEASIVINEVKLYPIEDRFIELYNQDTVEADLTDWYIQRKTQAGASFGSLVTSTKFENKKIGANEYFLISRTALADSDIVYDNLTLTESNTIQIKNKTGEVVDIICWGDVVDCGVYKTSNPTEGQSIQRSQSGLFTGTPTPGIQNESTEDDDADDTTPPPTTDTAPPSSSGGTGYSEKTETKKVETEILVKSIAFTGTPLEFGAETIGVSNEKLIYGKYFWNFGDGDSKETKANDTAKFTHIFAYEGEYNITLEYYENNYSSTPNAFDKVTIKVIKPDIIISSVGSEVDFFIEISNNTAYESDLSRWVLLGNQKSFILPKNTIVQSKKKIMLSPNITGLSFVDRDSLKLLSSYQNIVFDYNFSFVKAPEISKNTIPVFKTEEKITQQKEAIITEEKEKAEELEINLGAQALGSDVVSRGILDTRYVILLTVFLLAGGSAVYFVRIQNRKTGLEKEGSDFEILGE